MKGCLCPRNKAGDIRCHECGERVNVHCWNCGTPRGEGQCPTRAWIALQIINSQPSEQPSLALRLDLQGQAVRHTYPR